MCALHKQFGQAWRAPYRVSWSMMSVSCCWTDRCPYTRMDRIKKIYLVFAGHPVSEQHYLVPWPDIIIFVWSQTEPISTVAKQVVLLQVPKEKPTPSKFSLGEYLCLVLHVKLTKGPPSVTSSASASDSSDLRLVMTCALACIWYVQ